MSKSKSSTIPGGNSVKSKNAEPLQAVSAIRRSYATKIEQVLEIKSAIVTHVHNKCCRRVLVCVLFAFCGIIPFSHAVLSSVKGTLSPLTREDYHFDSIFSTVRLIQCCDVVQNCFF